jgi:hypothetical protein
MAKYKSSEDENIDTLTIDELVSDRKGARRKAYTEGDIKKMRYLPQYKNLSDTEYDALIAQRQLGIEPSAEFEKRIKEKMDKFADDYDLTELRVNDILSLRALCQAIISLEDLEQQSYKLRAGELNNDTIFITEKVSKMMTDLRQSISQISEDLKITRKHRKSDKEANVIAYIDDLKVKAKKFVEARSMMLWCKKCHTLLFQGWFLYPNVKSNKIKLVCQRDVDGHICGGEIEITTKELLEMGGRNFENIPEALK